MPFIVPSLVKFRVSVLLSLGRIDVAAYGHQMISSFSIRAIALLVLALSSPALGQNIAPVPGGGAPATAPDGPRPAASAPVSDTSVAVTISPDTIDYVPPLAKAVLLNDREEVTKALNEGAKVDEPVRAKEKARAGFTPLILAAALSEPNIASTLIGRGSRVTVLDDFHRSAFWYAALRGSIEVAYVLAKANGANDVINAADNDFQRTPLHMAVRGNEPQLVSLFLNVGASRDRRDILGETPGDYCKRQATEACKGLP